MAGEIVDLKIRAHAAKHGVSYAQAYDAVVHDEYCDDVVKDYKEGAPGQMERVRELEAEQSRLAGLVLNERAKKLQKAGPVDHRTAFAQAATENPTVARQYGVPDEHRPAQKPWWK
jgi:hypothetical protein